MLNLGNVYEKSDPLCPLSSVGTVIQMQNIYANIQSKEHPSHIHFDFSKPNDWKPLFEKPVEMPSIQPISLPYAEVGRFELVYLEPLIFLDNRGFFA